MSDETRPGRKLERHFSLEEVAASLGVSNRTARRWCKSGKLARARKLGPNMIRIPESSVEAFKRSMEMCPA